MTVDALTPSPRLLSKLGSIVIHAEEYLSPDAHDFDREAIRSLLLDLEVREWLSAMEVLAMVPLRRSKRL
jgi:hypothetical protein